MIKNQAYAYRHPYSLHHILSIPKYNPNVKEEGYLPLFPSNPSLALREGLGVSYVKRGQGRFR
jgi:hypothetical protein